MLTGENGILTQAQNAKKETSIAEEKEQIALAYNAAIAKKQRTDITAKELDDELKANGVDATATSDETNTNIKVTFEESQRVYTINSNGTITEGGTTTPTPPEEEDTEATVGQIVQPGEGNKEYISGEYTAIIPEGFMIVPGLDNIEEGLVISDNPTDTETESSNIVANGNQFVWVPVPDFDEFKRHDFANQGITDENFVTDQLTSGKYYEPTANGTDNTTEVEKMYKSVKENKGFYIGRYEAGNDGSNNAISKKNQNPYVNIGWNNDGTMTTETGGAVEKARNFSTQSRHEKVTSTLVYGVQWDAVMRWISEDENLAGYLTDSTGKGNYSGSAITTGSNPEYKLKNIYDMAGNVREWTMEANSTAYRVYRGGIYRNTGSNTPVSYRNGYSPDTTIPFIGFRLAFFV